MHNIEDLKEMDFQPYLIIVAGGKGLRMGADIPKQFLCLNGKPIIMHTIEKFLQALPSLKVVLVLNPDYLELWQSLCTKHSFTVSCTIALGGKERFDSVRNGLGAICPADDKPIVVGVHDAVRPLVSETVILNAYCEAMKYGAVVPVIPATDSIRMMDSNGCNAPIDRSRIYMVQTPQVFKYSVLNQAYSQTYNPQFTDDASVVESCGHKITLIEGNRENIKITTPIDLLFAETILKN